MNERVRDLWADALASGEFQRGIGTLVATRSDGSGELCYCCLGVLTELYHRETGLGGWTSTPSGYTFEFRDPDVDGRPGDRGTVYLTPAVMAWAGLDRQDPVLDAEVDVADPVTMQRALNDGALDTAASLNDSGTEFPEIAALVRRMPAAA